jgi:hypothetical protein
MLKHYTENFQLKSIINILTIKVEMKKNIEYLQIIFDEEKTKLYNYLED